MSNRTTQLFKICVSGQVNFRCHSVTSDLVTILWIQE